MVEQPGSTVNRLGALGAYIPLGDDEARNMMEQEQTSSRPSSPLQLTLCRGRRTVATAVTDVCTACSRLKRVVKPRITIVTLGVDDLERAVAFYRDGLGLPTQGIIGQEFEYGAVAFFNLSGGLKLALWPRSSIAHDAGVAVLAPSATDVTLAHNVNSKQEVLAVMDEVRRAGGKIVKRAADTFYGGYAGYFQDPDGHLWEVAWNPDIPVADD